MTTATPSKPTIDWARFYKGLNDLTVLIPVPGDGEVVAPVLLEQLLARVQANRQRVDEIGRKLLMRIGNARAKLSVAKHDLTVSKSTYMFDPQVRSQARTVSSISAYVEQLTMHEAGRVANLSGQVAELDAAISAIKMTIETFDRAKETLNAMHRGAIAEMHGRGN